MNTLTPEIAISYVVNAAMIICGFDILASLMIMLSGNVEWAIVMVNIGLSFFMFAIVVHGLFRMRQPVNQAPTPV